MNEKATLRAILDTYLDLFYNESGAENLINDFYNNFGDVINTCKERELIKDSKKLKALKPLKAQATKLKRRITQLKKQEAQTKDKTKKLKYQEELKANEIKLLENESKQNETELNFPPLVFPDTVQNFARLKSSNKETEDEWALFERIQQEAVKRKTIERLLDCVGAEHKLSVKLGAFRLLLEYANATKSNVTSSEDNEDETETAASLEGLYRALDNARQGK